eukprot:SAG31_NODE_486_length_15001_cov_8.454405_1_plen_29_part_10
MNATGVVQIAYILKHVLRLRVPTKFRILM